MLSQSALIISSIVAANANNPYSHLFGYIDDEWINLDGKTFTEIANGDCVYVYAVAQFIGSENDILSIEYFGITDNDILDSDFMDETRDFIQSYMDEVYPENNLYPESI